MKILVAIFMLYAAFVYSLNVFSQEYIPMNFEKGRWSVEYYQKDGYQEKIQVYCNGDTIIDNLLYSKLYQNRLRRIPPGDYVDTIVREYLGPIRNTEDKKVVLYDLYLDSAITIYDFNLSIGDTIHGTYDNLVITAIDSVEHCERYHKRYIEEGTEKTVTEGIGYSNGLLGYFHPFEFSGMYWETGRTLVCYTEVNNPKCQPCDFFVCSKSTTIYTLVYPVPAENTITIHSSKPITHVRLIDFLGKEISFKEISNQFIVEEKIENLCKGVYLVIIEFSDQTKTISQIVII